MITDTKLSYSNHQNQIVCIAYLNNGSCIYRFIRANTITDAWNFRHHHIRTGKNHRDKDNMKRPVIQQYICIIKFNSDVWEIMCALIWWPQFLYPGLCLNLRKQLNLCLTSLHALAVLQNFSTLDGTQKHMHFSLVDTAAFRKKHINNFKDEKAENEAVRRVSK